MKKITFEKLGISIKQILIVIGILALLGCGFAIRTGIDNVYQKGKIDGINEIVNQIKNGIRVNFDEGVILFVPKQ